MITELINIFSKGRNIIKFLVWNNRFERLLSKEVRLLTKALDGRLRNIYK